MMTEEANVPSEKVSLEELEALGRNSPKKMAVVNCKISVVFYSKMDFFIEGQSWSTANSMTRESLNRCRLGKGLIMWDRAVEHPATASLQNFQC